MKEREGKELHVMSHKMHLRLQKSKKAVSIHTKEKKSSALIYLFISMMKKPPEMSVWS